MASTTKNTITKLFSERKRNPLISWLLRNLRKDLGKTKRSLFTDVCIFNSFVLKKIQATSHKPSLQAVASPSSLIDVKLWMEFLAIIYYYPASNTVSVIIYALNEWREPNIFGVEGWYDREVQKELAIAFFWILGSLMNEQSWITSICLHFKLPNISLV